MHVPKHNPINVSKKFCIPGPSFLPSLVLIEKENYIDVSQTSFKGFNFKCRGQVVHMHCWCRHFFLYQFIMTSYIPLSWGNSQLYGMYASTDRRADVNDSIVREQTSCQRQKVHTCTAFHHICKIWGTVFNLHFNFSSALRSTNFKAFDSRIIFSAHSAVENGLRHKDQKWLIS